MNHVENSVRRVARLSMALVVLTAAACAKPPEKPQLPSEVAVRTTTAESKSIRRTKSYPGITASVRPVDLSARVQGFLATQHVKDGARVTAGTEVYSIEDAPFRAALDSARADLERAKAQVVSAEASVKQAGAQVTQANAQVAGAQAGRDLAARDVERNRPLVATGAISKQAFDQYESKLVEAESQLEAAKASVATAQAQLASAQSQIGVAAAAVTAARAQLESAELNLSYCTVVAPMDGLLGKSLASEGQMVGPGYTVALNTLVQTDPMWVQFSPSATEWPMIESRLKQGPVDAEVVYGGDAAITAKGTIVFSSNTVDPSTSTIMLRVEFPNPSGAFRPGTFANVTLDLGEIPGVVMVPATALSARETDLFVWRVKADSTVENVRVKATGRDGDLVGISEGLSAGDRVVVVGGQKLSAGAKVTEAPAAK
ncbi:MAG: efflux RND transporter periplasmic adaptor subunit [bacterium]